MSYLRHFILYFIVIICVIGLFNWFVDPYGMYWSPQTAINKSKPEASNRVRITKPYRVEKISPHILLMGNSRIEMGLSPHHPAFEGKRAYNLALSGATLHSQIDHIYHAIHHSPEMETIIFGLDFFDFLVTETGNETNATKTSYGHRVFTASGFSHTKKRYSERFALVYSLDALVSTFFTVSKQSAITDSIGPLGLNDAKSYVKIVETEGKKPLFKQKLDYVKEKLNQQDWQLHSAEGSPISPKFEKLLELIEIAKEKNIRLLLFINPYHYSYLHAIAQENSFDLYLRWKTILGQTIQEQNSQLLELWDFSGFNQYTLEPELLNKPYIRMKWYWEPAHYNAKLGSLIINTFYNTNQRKFGQRLDKLDVEISLENEFKELEDSRIFWENMLKNL